MADQPSFAQRRTSGLSIRSTSNNATSPSWQPHSRKSSQSSFNSAGMRTHSPGIQGDVNDPLGATNGLGSLADELQDGWDEEEEFAEEQPLHETIQNGHHQETVAAVPTLQPPSPTKRRAGSPTKHIYNDSLYDGSDYGDESDLEPADGISPGLERQMANIEALARQGASLTDVNWSRFASSLRDLPSQIEIENNTGRLVTTNSAVTSQLINQTRGFHSAAHAFISPFARPPHPDDVEEILPLVATLVTMLPKPPATSLQTIQMLNNETADLLSTLASLSDSLYMVRQTATTASRKMRSTRDFVDTLRKEHDEAEEGEKWLEQGEWERKLKHKEARRECEEVIGGFEEVCAGWRRKLIEMNGGMAVLDTAAA